MLSVAAERGDTSRVPLVVDLMTLELSVQEAEDVLRQVADYTAGPFLFYRYCNHEQI